MEFLDQAVLPQSEHHMVLIKYLLVLSYIIFIPYCSVLLGSLFYSLYFKKKGGQKDDGFSNKFSKDLIDLITFNKGAAFALGLVPLISAAFGYAQLLHATNLNVPEYIIASSILFFIALILIYTYKYSFHFKDIFGAAYKNSITLDENVKEEISKYSASTSLLNSKSGKYGLLTLLISVYLFIASVSLASDTLKWGSEADVFTAIFSLSAFTGFLQFLIGSFVLTSLIILFKYFRPNAEIELDSVYSGQIKSFCLSSALTFILIFPITIALNLIAKPIISFSFGMFGLTAIALLLLLLVSSLIYIMKKENHLNYNLSALFLLVIVFGLLIVKDQYVFDTATKKQFAVLSANYDAYELKLKEQYGVSEVKINGADIYNGRCIACHNFDKKIVGPPYNQTLPKYEGKKDALVKFILNPVKVNPEYPPMPNQGLKPNEAEAIAEYLLNTYKK